MSLIGNITGAASATSFVPLVVKYPLRKLNMHKANAYLMKLHEGASAGFLLFGAVHMIAQLCSHRGSAVLKYSGLFGLALSLWLIADCHMAKDAAKKMERHRWYSLFLTAAIACHIVSA